MGERREVQSTYQVTSAPTPIQSTAGAVTVINEKGEVSMAKVKVRRHIAGKRPDYAHGESASEDEDEETFAYPQVRDTPVQVLASESKTDRRLQRLQDPHAAGRHRVLIEAAVEEEADSSDEDGEPRTRHRRHRESSGEESDADSEAVDGDVAEDKDEPEDEDAIEARRQRILERMRGRKEADQEEMAVVDEQLEIQEEEASGSSEYESYTDSESEQTPLCKPVFVSKSQRLTIKDKEELAKKEASRVETNEVRGQERKQETRKMVAEAVQEDINRRQVEALLIDENDGNEEEEFELWKVRELTRVKRDRDERDEMEKERAEIERLREMTEEERQLALRSREKVITNAQEKGKYKFLQKYYHRGAFYMDSEEAILKRNVALPTLEDHFDKSIMPKVMQVKNFGRHGQTKYTHLKDQDTTVFDAAWAQDSVVNQRMDKKRAAVKQDFDRPSVKRVKRP